jgi:oxygen-independent coproporphyrinogen-3 oxidase
VDFEEELDAGAKRRELFLIQLRLREGIDLAEFQEKWGPLEAETLRMVKQLSEEGFLCSSNGRIALSPRGVLFYDTVAAELV